MKRTELEKYLNKLLNIYDFTDYCPNGLQIEGSDEITKIGFAVSATADSVEKSVSNNCNALIVHHGLFWKFHGPKVITKAFAKRVKPLIQNDISLLGYHLPLDANIELGNASEYQLYNLKDDLGEQNNLAESNEEKLKEMIVTFEEIRGSDYGQIQQLELK